MLRQFILIALVVIIGATPIARAVCLLSCTAGAATSGHVHGGADTSMSGHAMTGHRMASPASASESVSAHLHSGGSFARADSSTSASARCGVKVSAMPHGCGHADLQQVAAAPLAKLVIGPAALAPHIVNEGSPPGGEVPMAPEVSTARFPIPLSLRRPLRV
jgi:hypothetical protein